MCGSYEIYKSRRWDDCTFARASPVSLSQKPLSLDIEATPKTDLSVSGSLVQSPNMASYWLWLLLERFENPEHSTFFVPGCARKTIYTLSYSVSKTGHAGVPGYLCSFHTHLNRHQSVHDTGAVWYKAACWDRAAAHSQQSTVGPASSQRHHRQQLNNVQPAVISRRLPQRIAVPLTVPQRIAVPRRECRLRPFPLLFPLLRPPALRRSLKRLPVLGPRLLAVAVRRQLRRSGRRLRPPVPRLLALLSGRLQRLHVSQRRLRGLLLSGGRRAGPVLWAALAGGKSRQSPLRPVGGALPGPVRRGAVRHAVRLSVAGGVPRLAGRRAARPGVPDHRQEPLAVAELPSRGLLHRHGSVGTRTEPLTLWQLWQLYAPLS